MSSPLKYAALCLAGLAAACDDDGNDPAAPWPPDVPPAAAVQSAVGAPAIALSAHSLWYCYTPYGNRMCVILRRHFRITSIGANPLRWTASSDHPWIVVSPAGGTTPTVVTVSVDARKLPPWRPAYGSITISAAGASNSPQKISVVVNFDGRPLSPPASQSGVTRPLLGAPAIAFSDSAIGFCYSPGSTRNCVRLEEQVRFTSLGGRPLTWRAVSDQPWIVLKPARGTTPTDVWIYVAFAKLPPRQGSNSVSGLITVSAAGASNSPQTIPVKLQFYSSPPPR